MPSVTDVTTSPVSDTTQFNTDDVADGNKAAKAGGSGGRDGLTIEHASANTKLDAAANLIGNHTIEKPMPMSITEMMLQLSNMTSTLQGETVKIAEGMIDHNKDMIKKKSHERAKLFDKIQKMQRKTEKREKSAEAWGWIGTAVGVVTTAVSLGSLGPLAASCMVLSAGVGLGNQIATSAGAYDKMAKKDPEGAKALNYTIFAIQIGLSLAGMVASATKTAGDLSKSGSDIASKTTSVTGEASNLAKHADEAVQASAPSLSEGATDIAENTARISGEASNVTNAANETAQAASKTGNAMAGATSSEQMSDELVNGISDIARASQKGQQAAGEVVEGGEGIVLSTGSEGSRASIESAEGVVKNATGNPGSAQNASLADKSENLLDVQKMKTLEKNMSRVGHTIQGGVAIRQTELGIDLAILNSDTIDANANLQSIKKTQKVQQSFLDEIVNGLADMVQRIDDSARAAMDSEAKLHKSKISVTSNLGANTAQAV